MVRCGAYTVMQSMGAEDHEARVTLRASGIWIRRQRVLRLAMNYSDTGVQRREVERTSSRYEGALQRECRWAVEGRGEAEEQDVTSSSAVMDGLSRSGELSMQVGDLRRNAQLRTLEHHEALIR